jgi:hypothetical protein
MSNQRNVVLFIVGLTVASGLCLLVCCGGLVHFGLGIASEEVRNELEAHPRFVEHVGQVLEFSVDYVGSISNEESGIVEASPAALRSRALLRSRKRDARQVVNDAVGSRSQAAAR